MSGVRHTTTTRNLAISLRESGWSLAEVQAIMRREGIDPVPSANTIACWSNPDMHDRQRRRGRRQDQRRRLESATFRFGGPPRSLDWRMGRVRALAAAGVKPAAIVAVMRHDFPEWNITKNEVESFLRGHMPKSWRAIKRQEPDQ